MLSKSRNNQGRQGLGLVGPDHEEAGGSSSKGEGVKAVKVPLTHDNGRAAARWQLVGGFGCLIFLGLVCEPALRG